MARAGLPAGTNARRRDRVALLCTTALQAAAVLVLSTPAIAQLAPNARPTGGQVVGGQVGISQNAQTTTVQQSSQLGAVNWQSFNVGSAHAVQFQQPNAAATTLNRVVGPDPSMIAGKITANGNVVLVNQSGVVFSKGAQVDVNGLIVTSTNISNKNFMAGKMVFDQPGSPNARIVNHGQISVKESGLAALVAPSVANHGVINARMGKVVLAGAMTHTVDLYGDGLIAVDVTGQVKQAPIGPDGKAVTVLVTNTGTILADGGTVVLTAKAVDGIVNNLVTAGGKIQANTAGGRVGRIELTGVGGGLTIEGDVSAMGTMAGTKGGTVQALATGDVTVTKTARVDASGQAGGGTVAIGTTLARAAGPAVKNAPAAKSVTIERGATIAADATVNGKGGSVVVLAAGTTRMNGTISARGGWRGGDGGFVEISGKTLASITGKVDVTAPNGKNGSILIDPDFLTIVSDVSGNGDQDGTFTGAGGTIVAGDPSIGADTLSNGVLNAFLGDVLLQANQTITVGANVSLTNTPGQSLTLEAGGTIVVNTGVVLTVDGNVFLGTGGVGQSGAAPAAQPSPLISVLGTIQSNVGVVDLQAGTDGVITVGANGLVNAATAATLTATAMNIAGTIVAPNATLLATSGTLGLTGTINATSNATLNGSAGINAAAGRVIGGGGLLAISQFGAVNLSNANNAVFASIGLAATSFTLNNTTDLLLGDITAGTTATVTAPSILATGTITAPNVVLTANTGTLGISGVVDASTAVALSGQTGIVGNAGTLIGGGALSANSAAGAVDLTGSITVASASGAADTDFRLANTGALDLGNVTAGGSVVVAAPTLAVSGLVDATVADLTASVGTLTLTGTVDASASTFLTGQGGIAGSTGRVIGNGTLSATSGGGAIDLSNANNAVSNATVDAFGAVSLVDTGALTLDGARAGSAAVVTAETLTATGLINAPTVSLTASTGALTLTGTIDASSAVTLSGKTGIAGNAGTIIGDATLSAVSATGAVELTNAGNAIAGASGSAAGAFRLADTDGLNLGNVAAGSTVAVSAETLLAAGLVTAPTVSLTARVGALTLTGTVDASTTASLTGQAGIDGSTGLVKGGGTLTAISLGGSVDLTNAANAIVSATGTAGLGAFRLADTGGLNLGDVTASSTISATAATLMVAGTIAAPTVSLTTTTGTLGLTGVVDAASAAILSGQAGIAGATGRVIGGGALTADSAGGGIDLSNSSNAVSGASGSALTTFALADGITLNLGTVRAGTSAVVTAPTLATTGSIVSPTVSLTATSGALTLGGTIEASTTVALAGQAGIAGASGRIIGGGALTANSTAGAVDLNNVANAVASVTGSAAGTFAFANGTGLTLGNVTSTGGNVFLRSTHTNGITFGAGATVTSVAGGMVTLRADQIANLGTVGATGVVNTGATGTFELAPNTQGEVVSLGTVLLRTLSLESLTGITANLVRIGAYTAPTAPQTSSVTTAGSIAIGGTGFDMASGVITPATLELFAVVGAGSGKVDQTAPLLSVGTLTGSAGSFTLADPGNQIASVPRLTASTGITLTAATPLTLGTITTTGDSVVISATTLSVPGIVTAADVSLTASTGTLTFAGTIEASRTVTLAGKAGIAGATGRLKGGHTLSATSAAGSIAMGNTANAVADVSGSASGSFDFASFDTLNVGTITAGTAATLWATEMTVSGSIGAQTASLVATTGTLTVVGTIEATGSADLVGRFVTIPGTVIAPVATINAAGGALTLSGTLQATTANLSATDDIEGATGRVIGNTTLTAYSASGAVTLTNVNNAIASADGWATGAFAITSGIDLNLGTIFAGGTLTARAPTLTASGSIDVAAAILSATTGTLGVTGTVDATTRVVGTGPTVSVAGTIIAPDTTLSATVGTLTITGVVDAGTRAVLSGVAGIAGATGRIIGLGALTADSADGSVILTSLDNAVSSATGSAFGAFALVSSTDVSLGSISAGTSITVSAPNVTVIGTVEIDVVATRYLKEGEQVEVQDDPTVAILNAPTVSLTATTGQLVIDGTVEASAAAILSGQTGIDGTVGRVIGGGTLRAVSAAGAVTLTNPNNEVAAASGSASGDFRLIDSVALNLGNVTAGPTALIQAPTLTAEGSVAAQTVSLTATTGTLGITGTVNATTAAVLAGKGGIIGNTGTILGGGALTANSSGGAVELGNAANAVASVTGSALTGFTLVDSKGLEIGNVSAGTTASLTAPTATVQGDVVAENVTITATSGMLEVAGAVDATALAVLTGQTVSVTGGVFGQTTSITANTGRLDVSGTVDAGTLAVLSGLIVSVANTGSVIAPTTSIAASAGVLEVAGTVNATTQAELRGQSVSISGNVIAPTTSISALSGALEVTLGGTVNASTQADLRGQSVSIAGSVIAPTTSITASSGALSVGGLVNATTRADLSGLSVSIAGEVISPTTSITASLGALTVDGAVTASTQADLRGQSVSIGGNVISPTTSITATAGALTVDGAVTASTQAVLRGQSVSIGGDVISPTTSITATAGTLDVGGTVDASIIAVLTGETVSIAGSVIAPTTSITASVGTLGITGAITATTAAVLSGAAGIIGPTGTILGNGALSAISASGSVDLTNTANIIASLEGSAPGSFRVTDSVGLAILGGKSVTAETVGITAQSIANAGTVTASGAGSSTEPALRLIATGGTVSNSGLVQATSASAGNLLVSATSGIESSGTITAAGPGTADAPSLALITTGGSVIQTAGLIAASHEAGFLSARAPGGAIAFAGTLMTGISTTTPTGAMDLVAGEDITETVVSDATGSVVTGLLTASAGGNIALASTATTGNRIATLGAMIGGNVTLANARDLTIAGPVTADGGSVRIDVRGGEGTAGNLTNNGAITAASGSIRLTADGSIDNNTGAIISVGGNKSTAIRTIELIASGGTIGIASDSLIGATSPTFATITLSAGAGITTAGTIIAGTAVRMTAAAGSIDNNTGGMITAFGAGSADTPSIALIALGGTIGNAAGATISAPMTSGNISLQAGFGITTAGTITAGGSGAPTIAMTTGGMLAQSGGLISATNAAGSASLNAGSIDIAGLLTVGSAGTLSLTATGAISEGGGTGTIIAGRLTGSSGGTTTLDNLANQIGALGPFSAGSELTLLNSVEAMTVSGSITVSGENSTLFLRNGSSGGGSDLLLADDSRLQATNVTLLAPDRINGPDTTIVATALTLPNAGAAVTAANQIILGDPTSANPIPTNSIGRLGPIVANQSLVVMNATELLLGGDITAPTIRIGATNGLTIANNVTITTGGTVLALPAQSSVPPDTDASVGFNLALLDSSGTIDLGPRLTIQGLPGVAEPTMRIAQTQGGQVRFGELVAPSTSVVLHVGTGSAVSQGGGNIDVKNLFVFYRSGAPSIQLSGNVGGQSASGAATISRIGRETVTAAFGQTELGLIFDPSSVYQINQCSITSVNCVLTSTLQIPPQLPLQTLYLPLPPSVLDDPDLLLPFISDQDD